jgi:hypothetical protein
MRKAAFVSVLKPVDDIRLFHKIAQTWQEAGYQVHSIGFYSSAENQEQVFFYPIFKFKRLSIRRLLAVWQIFWLLLKIRPQDVVCGSVEALPLCVVYKIIFFRKTRLFYDVQENYYANIRYTRTYPSIIRYPLAFLVRFIEYCSGIFVHCFLLAEQCYAQQLPFLGKKFLILENKPLKKFFQKHFSPPSYRISSLACVGTIAEEYGIYQALDFFEKISHHHYTLYIHGRVAKPTLAEKLSTLASEQVIIRISGQPVPYTDILDTMRQADILLMPYPINRAYAQRIPTKFYEAMALNKWILVSDNPHWHYFFIKNQYTKVLFIDFEKITEQDAEKILHYIDEKFLQSSEKFNVENIFWESEKQGLLDYLNQ